MQPDAAGSNTSKHGTTQSAVRNSVWQLWLQLQGLGHDHLLLAALETRRAGESLLVMLVAGIVLAVLLISVWLGLLAAAVLMMMGNGMVASSAILLAVVFNLLLALIICQVIRRKSAYLQFPATLNSLQSKPVTRSNSNDK
jgi:hypothetical protein